MGRPRPASGSASPRAAATIEARASKSAFVCVVIPIMAPV